jgi:hypothetical protein
MLAGALLLVLSNWPRKPIPDAMREPGRSAHHLVSIQKAEGQRPTLSTPAPPCSSAAKMKKFHG